ncbi:hypothetical protein C7C56_012125 [Massilia glaciei]|uniref:Uncharacterized protein n=1 Tax=Massilia glaciei TaxID=1524097 RepID=A0A2U2HLK1_9BURK|nr:hypothetical protein C7C56_012125 [Massilia glaciei]
MSTWADAADPRRHAIQGGGGYRHGYATVHRANTVLDRALFRPGETVSMRHFLRQESKDGLDFVPRDKLPGFVVLSHLGSDKRWSIPLVWDGAVPPPHRALRLRPMPRSATTRSCCPRTPPSTTGMINTTAASPWPLSGSR